MIGIIDYGVYLPDYRLFGDTFEQVWGRKGSGSCTVANYDEDSLTMAISALDNCLSRADRLEIDGLYFASTTSPYQEKQGSTLLAFVADLHRNVITGDFGNSLRAGTSALLAAVNAVKAGSARQVAVVAADCRSTEAGSDLELSLGDGAAAVLVGTKDILAEIIDYYLVADEFLDVWRTQDDKFIHTSDTRFMQLYGYERVINEAIQGLLKKVGLAARDVNHAVIYSPDLVALKGLTKLLGFLPEAYESSNILGQVGNTGTSSVLLGLAGALEKASPGDTIVLAGYGQGCEAILLRVTDKVKVISPKLKQNLATWRKLENYGKYLNFRHLLAHQDSTPFSSDVLLWREQEMNLRLYGQRCDHCGAIQFPARRVCWKCHAKDNFKEIPLSRTGKVVTFTKDTLASTLDPPVIMAVVDLDGGGRIYAQITDCDPSTLRIDMPVSMTFRKYHQGGGFHNYFWKFRPRAEGGAVDGDGQ